MAEKTLSLTQKLMIDQLSMLLFDEKFERLDHASIIRLLRKRLHMTQKQLAARSGVPQSFISKLEGGDQEPTLKTLRKLFHALSCSLVVVPIAHEPFDDVLSRQAKKYVKKNIEYVEGTMSLEKQLPDKQFMDALLEDEIKRLLYSGSSEIWDVE
ncbi:MAG: helix-turn-helix domain-containing protein [Chlamydiales bacterium]|nr:helix-turn-helix domain-containing protein [Chlamydiales bacterium]